MAVPDDDVRPATIGYQAALRHEWREGHVLYRVEVQMSALGMSSTVHIKEHPKAGSSQFLSRFTQYPAAWYEVAPPQQRRAGPMSGM